MAGITDPGYRGSNSAGRTGITDPGYKGTGYQMEAWFLDVYTGVVLGR